MVFHVKAPVIFITCVLFTDGRSWAGKEQQLLVVKKFLFEYTTMGGGTGCKTRQRLLLCADKRRCTLPTSKQLGGVRRPSFFLSGWKAMHQPERVFLVLYRCRWRHHVINVLYLPGYSKFLIWPGYSWKKKKRNWQYPFISRFPMRKEMYFLLANHGCQDHSSLCQNLPRPFFDSSEHTNAISLFIKTC